MSKRRMALWIALWVLTVFISSHLTFGNGKWNALWKVFWSGVIVTAECVIVAYFFAREDKTYTGTNIKFRTGRAALYISGNILRMVTFKAVSSEFFVLRNESNGETIVGVPTQPPLSWSRSKYFVAGPQEILSDYWRLFSEDNVTVKISNDKNKTAKVRVVATEPELNSKWVGLFYLTINILIILIYFKTLIA